MPYLFSSESVSEGHPDKVADQISDAILDQFLAYDPQAHVACESFVTTGQVVIMGEVSSEVYIDLQTVARNTIKRIGYTKAEYQFDGNSCGILSAIHEQSQDINRGVSREEEDEQGAGDQGMMFGYATNETENFMPVSLDLAHLIMRTLADIRKEGKEMTYLRPDAKSQVTVQYSDEEQSAIKVCAISFVYENVIPKPEVTININSLYSQSRIIEMCSAFYLLGNTKDDCVTFVKRVFSGAFANTEDRTIAKKIKGTDRMLLLIDTYWEAKGINVKN